MGIDLAVFRLVNHVYTNGLLDRALPFLTDGTRNLVVLIVAGLAVLLGARLTGRREAWRNAVRVVLVGALAVGLGELIGSHLLKNTVCRLRPPRVLPDVRLLVGLGPSYSFPSSHATNTMAVCTALSLGYRRWIIPAMLYAAIIGYSRVYVGVHWPTDVLAGLLLGALCAWALWRLSARWCAPQSESKSEPATPTNDASPTPTAPGSAE